MKKFIKEFQAFAVKGNVVDLAVAVVIGGAFGKIVSSLVNDVVMPLVGILLGGIDFSDLSVTFGKAEILYGSFIQSIIDFGIIAFVIFLAVKMINTFNKKEEEKEEVKIAKEVLLLEEIRDLLKNK